MADPNSPLVRFQVWRASLPPAIRLLLTINIAVYLAYVVLSIVRLDVVFEWLVLPGEPGAALVRPWTVLTYGFANLYPGFFGLISFAFAMLWLNWIGRDLEETYGSHQLMGLYVLAMLGGAAAALIAGALGGAGLYFGAWGPVGAVIVAAAVLNPNRGIGLMFIGVISLKWIAIIFVALDLAFSRDITHVGAYLAGGGFALAQKGGVELGAWTRFLFRDGGAAPSPMASTGFGGGGGGFGGFRGRGGNDEGEAWKKAAAPEPRSRTMGRRRSATPAAPTQADVDRILDKIHDKGMDSLTKEEQKILEAWSGKA